MQKNLRHFLILVLVFTISQVGFSQVEKGNYIIDFSSNLNKSNAPSNDVPLFANLSVNYLKLVSDKIMLGGNLGYSRGYYGTLGSTTWEYYPYSQFQISPTIRYYPFNKKIEPFISFQNNFVLRKYEREREGFFEDSNGYQGTLGLGFNYFLTSNIALESMLTSNLIRLGDFKQNSSYIAFSTGLKLFVNSPLKNKIEDLPSKVFKKGNFNISSSFISASHSFDNVSYSRLSLNSYEKTNFSLSPNIKYYLLNRLNIYAGIRLYKPSEYYLSKNFSLGVEYHVKLSNALYWNIGIGGNLTLSENSYLSTFPNSNFDISKSRTINAPVAMSLNYFVNQMKFYLGWQYISSRTDYTPSRDVYTSIRSTFDIGVDYFLSENVYINGELNYRRSTNSYSQDISVNRFSKLGIGFIFNKSALKNRKEIN